MITQAPFLQTRLRETAREAASLEKKLPDHVPGEVLVKARPGLSSDGLGSLADDYQASVVHHFAMPDAMQEAFAGELVQLKLPKGMSVAQAIAALEKDERVEYAVSNDRRQLLASTVPDDLDPRLWGLHNTGQDGGTAGADISAQAAWTVSTGSRQGPVIAVIDTGVDYGHPDLAANIWTNPAEIPGDGIDNDGNGVIDDVHGYNAADETGDPMDDNSHGTHCSGTIAAEGNNGQGVVGVNWQAQVMAVKFLSASGGGSVADVIKSVVYATANGARLTSNSYGGGANEAEYEAFKASPLLHVCAAGNESRDNDRLGSYPASYDLPNIISVAASDRNDALAGFSNWGASSVDLAAPGVDILSTLPGGRYGTYSGTSMATPHVAGVAGLIATAYPEASNDQIKSRLLGSSDPVGEFAGKMVSGGRLNAAAALENDTVAPAAPNDFGAARITSRGVDLSWTATADDGWCGGPASGFQLRVAERPIGDGAGEVPFEQASVVDTAAPGATGTIERARLDLIPSGSERTLHFALRVADNVGNLSDLRTAAVTVPAASVAFEDRMEGDESAWQADQGWGRIDVEGRGKVWTDSPGGRYGNDANSSLTSPVISLEGVSGASLVYDAKVDVEDGYDFVKVEARSGDGGWVELDSLTGRTDWATRSLDLSAFDGQPVQIRFRLVTDASVTKDGFALDRVVVAGD